jgi:uncharacterized protein (DUF1015 family)
MKGSRQMAVIAPFMGLTYDFYKMRDFSHLVAPPYDVISEAEQDALYKADPKNVIRLILGKKKTGDSDWDNRYTRAADYLRRWESDGTLIRADHASLYVTSITYDLGDGSPHRTRWGFIALVRLEEEDSKVILPHERTFSAHKEDRLKLMRACNAHFSQIFGLYEDREQITSGAFQRAIDFPPHLSFELDDGTRHRMWILQSRSLAATVSHAMREKTIFIADGHHRYETSRNFRNILRARYGQKPENRAYEFVMMYLTNIHEEGLTILPSHRMIKKVPGFQLDPFLQTVARWFHVETLSLNNLDLKAQCEVIKDRLRTSGEWTTALVFQCRQSDQYYFLTLRPGASEDMGQDLHPALRKLDVMVLSRLLLQKSLGFSRDELDNEENFHYQSSLSDAISSVKSGQYEINFILNPTKIEHVQEIASHSLVMPRKSTYFYPKVLTGLVFNKIDPHELIKVP